MTLSAGVRAAPDEGRLLLGELRGDSRRSRLRELSVGFVDPDPLVADDVSRRRDRLTHLHRAELAAEAGQEVLGLAEDPDVTELEPTAGCPA